LTEEKYVPRWRRGESKKAACIVPDRSEEKSIITTTICSATGAAAILNVTTIMMWSIYVESITGNCINNCIVMTKCT
jgi:hypothetical protein